MILIYYVIIPLYHLTIYSIIINCMNEDLETDISKLPTWIPGLSYKL